MLHKGLWDWYCQIHFFKGKTNMWISGEIS